jgi:Mrp family chromosome partitioning ATPase
LNQQVVIYTDQLAALSVQTAQLAGASRNPGQVLTPASKPAVSGVPTAALTLVGAIVGLLVGLGFAVVRESGNRRLREASEVESAGLPLLATLKPSLGAPPDAEEIERYRALRTAVLTHAPAPQVIEVCTLSSTSQSGDVAAGLGTALARAGSEATVVLAAPGSDRSRESRAGLAEVLLEDSDARELRENVAPGLYLLEPGRQVEAAAEMFASEKLRTTLRDLAGSSGYVLVAAPVTGTTASTALAVVCDRVILVSPLEETSVHDLTTAVSEVERLGGRVLGAVAVEPTRQGSPHLRRVSASLARVDWASVARWRPPVPKRMSSDADTSAEHRLRALSTVATALEHRIARARSDDVPDASEPAAAEPTAQEEVGASSSERPFQATDDASPSSSDGAAEAAGATGTPAPSGGRKRAATTNRAATRKRSSASRRKHS